MPINSHVTSEDMEIAVTFAMKVLLNLVISSPISPYPGLMLFTSDALKTTNLISIERFRQLPVLFRIIIKMTQPTYVKYLVTDLHCSVLYV